MSKAFPLSPDTLRVGGLGIENIVWRGCDIDTLQTHLEIPINIKEISNIKNLVAAYETIKSNPGNMTPGLDTITLEGINPEYLKKIQAEIKAGKLKFSPTRRVQKPKHTLRVGKPDTRPLTIASPREKIVQKALQQVIIPLYEKKYLESSLSLDTLRVGGLGFRPKRGTRTAISFLESKFQSVRYIIEIDFSKALDKIPHDKLLSILKEEIKCEKTIALIRSRLKAGFAEKNPLHEQSTLGTPQGSTITPLLCNIYLHKLDLYIEELTKEFNTGTRKARAPEYTSLINKIRY